MTTLAMTRGDTRVIQSTIASLPVTGLAGCSLWFTVKRLIDDLDNAAVCQKTVGSGITVITVGSDVIPGVVKITLVPADTSALGDDALLVWDLQLLDGSGVKTTVDSGTLLVSADVTRA